MKTIYLSHPLDHSSLLVEPTVFALGYFDGVHKGHKHVISQAVTYARENEMKSAVMTFHPHPKEVLQKLAEPMHFLTPLPDKLAAIAELGVDKTYVVEFNQSFADLLPQQFVDQYLITLGAKHVVAGFDFTYGKWGRGTMDTLSEHSRESFTLSAVPKVEKEGIKVSSTALRALLNEGKVEKVADLLGHPYQVEGTVVDGEKRGRSIGFPTANVMLDKRYVIPKTGVYVVSVRIGDEQLYGMCNVGYKPTFHEKRPDAPNIEVHLLEFDKQIYGKNIFVTWLQRLRDEKRFNGIDELIAQLQIDKQRTETYARNNPIE
ncbi:bifunctional riboflavin kinase/FAD synthetase [Alkalicoccobacillus porphyridii]|uniref:Riboflavin biosynthesis protein n=1 Tax=Alkalicoccobacillus porphyridii TaxID=2597270 RepID=A0A553ZYD1_9BACI|nr:bifunctional riboflavin kinase/FAD synthetase [Alkalicoccobacillus porphyridii]TSB46450.1 bifunctional riboflavin kinase/FAD synthetase [Alkalicoccobacillus porphyridii]